MTWSVVARDPDTGFFAVAIATRFFAVGAVCPWAEGGAGAVSTQALINPTLGPRGLALLRQASRAEDACDMLVHGDEGRGAPALRAVHARLSDTGAALRHHRPGADREDHRARRRQAPATRRAHPRNVRTHTKSR